jgi:hypothetical protein
VARCTRYNFNVINVVSDLQQVGDSLSVYLAFLSQYIVRHGTTDQGENQNIPHCQNNSETKSGNRRKRPLTRTQHVYMTAHPLGLLTVFQ